MDRSFENLEGKRGQDAPRAQSVNLVSYFRAV